MNIKKINIADFFALVRVFTFPIVLYFILEENRTASAWLYLILFSTDALDGFFAIVKDLESDRRQKLDTIGDILFLLVGLAGLYVFEPDFFIQHFTWIAVVLLAYLSELVASILKFGKPSSFHTYSAKVAAFFQVLFLIIMLFYSPVQWLFYAAAVLSILDAVEDIFIVLKLDKYQTNVKGLLWLEK